MKSASTLRVVFATLVTLNLALVASCRPAPPAAPAPATAAPAPVAVSPSPPPPAPAPKCESLTEKCVADANTRLPIGPQRTTFAPPIGWTYATTAERATAMHPGGVGLLVMSFAPTADDAAIATVIEREVTTSSIRDFAWTELKRRWKKPDGELPFGAGKVALWEVDAKRQRGKAPKLGDYGPGTLLVGIAQRASDEPIVALGFVLDTATESDAPKLVMDALGSLQGANP